MVPARRCLGSWSPSVSPGVTSSIHRTCGIEGVSCSGRIYPVVFIFPHFRILFHQTLPGDCVVFSCGSAAHGFHSCKWPCARLAERTQAVWQLPGNSSAPSGLCPHPRRQGPFLGPWTRRPPSWLLRGLGAALRHQGQKGWEGSRVQWAAHRPQLGSLPCHLRIVNISPNSTALCHVVSRISERAVLPLSFAGLYL